MRRLLVAVAIGLSSLMFTTKAEGYGADRIPVVTFDKALLELQRQLRDKRTPPLEYWLQVAVCESSLDGTTARWNDGGTWSGGLGIYIGTWVRWGGREFAKKPQYATPVQQIVVANRIAVHGYYYGYYAKKPVGFNGWGCIKNRKSLDPKKWGL